MITQEAPTQTTRIQAHTFSRIAVGLSPNNRLLVVGLTSGKSAGQPAALSSQISPYGNNNWQPCYTPLTGPVAPKYLKDIVVAVGDNTSHAVGLGNDGNLYCTGSEANGQWTLGAGLFSQPLVFQPGSLSAQTLNTATVFALSAQTGTPYVAAYRSQSSPATWLPGFALNSADTNAYSQLVVRPEVSSAGTTHAIGRTVSGQAREVALGSGPGVGSGNWSAGHGQLGGGALLPTFSQLLVVSGDAAGLMHVLGLGTDGSVWDIDQFTPNGNGGGTWSAASQQVVPAGTISGSKIDFYLGAGTSINLVAWCSGQLAAFAGYTTAWSSASPVTIPTAGVASEWHVATNCQASKYGTVFVLGAAITGLVYELAYLNTQGVWEAGAQVPINQ